MFKVEEVVHLKFTGNVLHIVSHLNPVQNKVKL